MRELIPNDKNEILISDIASDTVITYYYRMPVTSDRLNYQSRIINALQNGDTSEVGKEQIDFILEFITGFSEDSFAVNGKPISSDKTNKNYYEGWKAVLRENVSDHLLNICQTIFGQSNLVLKKNSVLAKNLMNRKTPGLQKKKKNT